MANWGVPDFTDTVSDQEMQALHARIKAETKGEGLVEWSEHDLVDRGYNAAVIQEVCVRRADWQAIRLSMKGINTHDKLAILKAWWDKTHTGVRYCDAEIQVGNYLGALRRGGQLDDYNRVRRYR